MTSAPGNPEQGNRSPDAEVALVGDVPLTQWLRCEHDQDLPADARLIVMAVDLPDADRLAALRTRHPGAKLIAWLAEPTEPRVEACVRAGFDDVALSSTQLAHSVLRWRQVIRVLDAHAAEQETHQGLVRFIAEINARPQLAEVLCTAVLRLSELFNIDRVSVVLFKPGDEVAFVVAEHEESLIDNLVIRISDYPELGALVDKPEPLVIADMSGEDLLRGVRSKLEHAKEPPRGAVLFPLLHKGGVVGALFVRSKKPMGRIEDRLLSMGKLIASVTSVAIGAALEQDDLQSERRALLRKKAEADQRLAGLQQFSELFAQVQDGILVTDLSGEIRFANLAASRILGRESEALKGSQFLSLLAAESRGLGKQALAGEAPAGQLGYVDLRIDLPEGGIVLSAAIRRLQEPEGVLVSFRDVTEVRKIEAELRRTKEFLENLIQSSVDAVVAADIRGQIILFNRAAEQMLGFSATEVVNAVHVDTLYPPGEARDVMRRLRSDAYGGRGRLETTRKELVAKSGELVPVSLTASTIVESGREVATVGVFTDLRERLKMEEKLNQVQRRLQVSERQSVAMELAGTTAHELNQPLTSILGYAEMLRRRLPPDDPNRKPVEVICRETERMAQIVRKIGQITAYETKTYVGTSQILDLGGANGPLRDTPPKR